MKTTSFCIILLTITISFSWFNPSAVLSKRLTNHQKNLRVEAQYLTLLDTAPDDTNTRIQLAQLYSKKNNYNKAVIHFEKALASGSQLPEIYIGLAFCQQQLGDIDEAIQTCQQGIAANPNNGEVHLRLGNLYHRKGMNDAAEAEYALYRQLGTDK